MKIRKFIGMFHDDAFVDGEYVSIYTVYVSISQCRVTLTALISVRNSENCVDVSK